MVLGHKAMLDRGESRRAGEEVVRGISAVKVERRGLAGRISAIDAYLDKTTGLPLKEVAYGTGSTGALQELEIHQVTYTGVERLTRSRAPAGLFSVASPTGWSSTVSRYLTPATARGFGEFDLYWLGPGYGGLPLFGITHDEVLRTPTLSRPVGGPVSSPLPMRHSSVAVLYAHPFVNGRQVPGQISVVQGPPPTAEDLARRQQLPAPGKWEPVSIGGRLYTDPDGHAQVELTIGRTFVTVHGADRSQVLQAAQALRRLN
jgi:hypothetical protein